MSAAITSFRGKWHAFSNFYVNPDGKTNEHSFQAAKFDDPAAKAVIMAAETPGRAKRLGGPHGAEELAQLVGHPVKMREDWDSGYSIEVMRELLAEKFSHPELQAILLASGDAELVEGNHWHDNRWGVCTCASCGGKGTNWLGKLLMELRAKLQAES